MKKTEIEKIGTFFYALLIGIWKYIFKPLAIFIWNKALKPTAKRIKRFFYNRNTHGKKQFIVFFP